MTVNQYKEHIKRLRDSYNAAVWASSPFYDEQEDYRSWELDHEAHADACAHIIADAYRKGDYAHMWEALNEALKPRDDDCDEELTGAILTETISKLQWNTQPINTSVFDNDAFTRMVLDSLAPLTAGYAAMTLELVIEALGEGDDTEYANSLTIMEHAASIILARTPPIGERDTKRVTRSLPFLSHQSIANHIVQAPGEQETTFTRLGDKILRCEAIACEEIGDDAIFFINADTNLVREAARRWRDTIARAEEHGDNEMEAAARRAHAYLCLALLNRRALPHMELATLIDTMQTPVTGVETITIVTDASVWRKPITTVGRLIDYAATRMSAEL
jgi:hypothetical protein